jgi:hypothetical protein
MSEEEIGQEVDRVIRAASMALGQLREHASRKQAERDAATRTQYDEQRRLLQQRMGELHEAVRSPDFWASANGDRVADTVDVIVAAGPDIPHGQNTYDTVRGNLERRYGIDLDELRTTHAGDASGRRRALIDAVDDAVAARKQSADADAGTADDLASEAAIVASPEKHADLVDGSEQALTSADVESQDANALQAGADATATAAIPADQAAASASAAAQAPGGSPATPGLSASAATAASGVTRPLTATQQARATVDASYPMTVRESLTSAAATGQVKPQKTSTKPRNRQREATRTR